MGAHLTPEHLEFAIEKQRAGWTNQRIAKELGVHRQTVSRSLNRHNRRAWERFQKRTGNEQAKQVQRLEWIIEQAAEAFPLQFDAALLNQMRGAMADIRKIGGLDAPEKKPPGDDRPQHDLGGVANMVVEMVERMSKRADGGDSAVGK